MFLRRLARLRHEEGIALVMSLVYMTVALSAGGTITYFAATNTRHAAYERGNQKAFAAAEAGLNEAIAVLGNSTLPTVPTTLPASEATAVTDTTTIPGSTIKYWGTYDAGSQTWTVYGKGTTSAPATTSRTVNEKIRIGAGAATLAGNPAWGTIFADNKLGGCLGLTSSVRIYVPMYVTGDLCLTASAAVDPSAGSVTVLGKIDLSSSAQIGKSTAHLSKLNVVSGCRFGGLGSWTFPCTTTQRVWADNQLPTAPALAKPIINLPYWFLNAKPGPKQYCTSGSFPPGFDNDFLMDGSLGTVSIFTASAYDCVVAVSGHTVGEIKWTPGNPGSFYLNGTVFIDGNIATTNSDKVDYTGRGTIYAFGSISISNSLAFCGARSGPKCNYATGMWDPEQKLIGWIAGTTLDIGSGVDIQGAFYATTSYSQSSTASVQGPIIATIMNMFSSSQAPWLPFNTLPDGLPGASSAYTVAPLPGTWSG
jgi:Tfp pilus assembly protein PilX